MSKTPYAVLRMIEFYKGVPSDVNHTVKVLKYCETIEQLENVGCETREIIEAAAVMHDIACPLCREKYGSADGKYQEKEGPALAETLMRELGYRDEVIERVCYLVGHHHTYTNVDGIDYRILLEADYLVNADEMSLSYESIRAANRNIFKTESGKALLRALYPSAFKTGGDLD